MSFEGEKLCDDIMTLEQVFVVVFLKQYINRASVDFTDVL